MVLFENLSQIRSRLFSSGVIWSFLVTGIRTGGFFLILPLILRNTSSEELGFWYVLLGISQFAGIVELGFAPTIGRFASYYMGGATHVSGLGLADTANSSGTPNIPALMGLIQTAKLLYIRIATGMGFLMLAGGGAWLFWKYPDQISQPYYLLSFALFIFGTTVNMIGFFWPGLLFGLNEVATFQQSLIAGILLNYLITFLGLVFGLGLFALVLGQFALGLYTRLYSRRIVLKKLALPIECVKRIDWRELWPMTWRSGVGSFAAFLSLPVTTLLCAQTVDLETTASYGLSLQLALMLHALSGSWLTAIWPRLSIMRVQGRFTEIRTLLAQRLSLSVLTFVCGAIGTIVLAPHFLTLIGSKTTFLATPVLALLFLTVLVDFIVGAHATTIQSGNQTPYLRAFIITGGLTLLGGLLLGHFFGVIGIILAPLLAQASFSLWHTPFICWKDLWSSSVIQSEKPLGSSNSTP